METINRSRAAPAPGTHVPQYPRELSVPCDIAVIYWYPGTDVFWWWKTTSLYPHRYQKQRNEPKKREKSVYLMKYARESTVAMCVQRCLCREGLTCLISRMYNCQSFLYAACVTHLELP